LLRKFTTDYSVTLYTSMNTHVWLVKLITALISIFQASTLRDRYYLAQERITILETAIEDIARISASRVDNSERHRLIAGICSRVGEPDAER
jgi:hypothetical protein